MRYSKYSLGTVDARRDTRAGGAAGAPAAGVSAGNIAAMNAEIEGECLQKSAGAARWCHRKGRKWRRVCCWSDLLAVMPAESLMSSEGGSLLELHVVDSNSAACCTVFTN